MKRDFISILDWTSEEIRSNLDFAIELKHQTKEGKCPKLLQGKTFGLFFHKPSLRTRLSFEVGITQLGGTAIVLTEQDFKIGEREAKILVEKRGQADDLEQLSFVYYAQGRYVEAESLLVNLLATDPENKNYRDQLQVVRLATKKPENSEH